MSVLSEFVKDFMARSGMNSIALARKVGTSRQNIENLVAGNVTLPSYIVRLADAMDMSIDELLGRRPRPFRNAEAPARIDTVEPAVRMLRDRSQSLPASDRRIVATLLSSFVTDEDASEHQLEALCRILQAQSPSPPTNPADAPPVHHVVGNQSRPSEKRLRR